MEYMDKNYCVITAGGVGSRLWPLSRRRIPKQFIDMFGVGRTLLQQTYDRCCKLAPRERILVITNQAYTELVREQLPDLPEDNILSEPARRNTAPCVAWAVYHIYSMDPEADVVIVPSDQLVLNEELFCESMRHGFEFVSTHEKLLCIGIRPTRPETRYGYIQQGDAGSDGFYAVKTFTEKPEAELAEVFVESGEFYWNAGIFLGNASVVVDAFRRCIPELAARFDAGVGQQVYATEQEQGFVEELYAFCPNISVEYGILEKADNVYVAVCDFGWSDLGTWDTYYEASEGDADGNVVKASDSLMYACKSCFVSSQVKDKLVVLEGLEDYLVVDTDDVLLVCPKQDPSSLRKYVNDAQMKCGERYV